MWKLKCLAILPLLVVTLVTSTTGDNAFLKEDAVDELRAQCAEGNHAACMKLKVVEVMDDVLRKDTFQLSESVSVVRNPEASGDESRGDTGLLEHAINYLRTHDVLVNAFGARVTLSPRNINQGEMDIRLKYAGEEEEGDDTEQGRSKLKKKLKKGKLKKFLVPVAIFFLLKAMTLIPLLLGILGVKAWNALQLSFGSFVVSFALAIYQLCQKLAGDSHPPVAVASPIVSHHGGGWDASAARGMDMAYRAHRR